MKKIVSGINFIKLSIHNLNNSHITYNKVYIKFLNCMKIYDKIRKQI
jgi:hypothetical protein